MAHHVHRNAQMGTSVMIIRIWYETELSRYYAVLSMTANVCPVWRYKHTMTNYPEEPNKSDTDENERYAPEDGAPKDKRDASMPKDPGNPTN